MKIGFSTLACPGWDLRTVIAKAVEFGYSGVEIRGLGGRLDLTGVPELAGNPESTRQMFAAAEIDLVCLSTSCTLDSKDRKKVARSREEICEYIDLASRLGCPYVRMFPGDKQSGDTRESALARIGSELAKVAPYAGEKRVTVLVQNAGDFSNSADLWYLCDYVSHPGVKACWNLATAMMQLDRPTVALPRLGNKIGMVHVCDAEFDEQGFMRGGYKMLGEGNIEVARAIELLRGMCYAGYLMFEWPRLWDGSLADAETALPGAAAYLKKRIDDKQAILTAYKGDKKKPLFKPMPGAAGSKA